MGGEAELEMLQIHATWGNVINKEYKLYEQFIFKTQVPNRYKTFREFIQRPFSTNYLTSIYYGVRTELARKHRTLLSLLKDKPIHFLQTFKQ